MAWQGGVHVEHTKLHGKGLAPIKPREGVLRAGLQRGELARQPVKPPRLRSLACK